MLDDGPSRKDCQCVSLANTPKTSSMTLCDSQMFCKTESTESERVVVSVSCRGVVATRFVGLEYSMRGHEGCDTIVSH